MNHPTIELRHLRYFAAVADTENFTRAAERLGVSQPSVSQQIKELELQLGTPLFARLGRRVRLTEAGLALRRHAAQVLERFDQAVDAVHDVATLERAHLDVGVIPAMHLAFVPRVLERLAKKHPGLSVSVHERSSPDVEAEVEAGRYDLGLGLLSETSPNLEYRLLLEQGFSLITSKKHALARCRTVEVRRLAGLPLVALPQSYRMRHEVEHLLLAAQVRPRIAHEVDTIDGVLAAVRATGAATLLPALVLDGRAIPGLVAIRLERGSHTLRFGLHLPKGGEPTPAARAFIAELERR